MGVAYPLLRFSWPWAVLCPRPGDGMVDDGRRIGTRSLVRTRSRNESRPSQVHGSMETISVRMAQFAHRWTPAPRKDVPRSMFVLVWDLGVARNSLKMGDSLRGNEVAVFGITKRTGLFVANQCLQRASAVICQ